MMSRYAITCDCGYRMQVAPEQLGRRWKCTQCGRPIVVTLETVDSPGRRRKQAAVNDHAAEDSIPIEWQTGDVYLGLYEVVDVLGHGGMGTVYKVHHRGWDIDLAVKSPKPELLQRGGGPEYFEQECETWVNLGLHPYIVSCYYVRRLGGIPRIFAEYVEGGSLFEWIRKGRLYEGGGTKALALMLQIAIHMSWGLHHAHSRGLIHRDVKPGNVMLTGEGTAKLTDFGLAQVRAAITDDTDTQAREAGTSAGPGGMTRAYCSPEQANGEVLTPKTDIWSWGVTVLHMFTGKVTWHRGVEALQALNEYLEKGPAEKGLPRMPTPVAELLKRCFQVDKAGRPQDVLEAGTVLQKVYEATTGNAFPFKAPVLIEAQAESLNNRAISLVDLGKKAEAERLWREAIQAVPNHCEATFNLGLTYWRSGRITDDALLYKLHEVAMLHQGDALPLRLTAQVHLERGDCESALRVLGAIRATGSLDQDVETLLRTASRHREESRGLKGVLEGHKDAVVSVALSPDGCTALSGSEDNTVMVWEATTGRCVRTLEGHAGSVEAVCLSADGRLAVSGSRDKTLRVWELTTGRCLHTFENHRGAVRAVSLSPDSRVVVLTGADNRIVVYEMEAGAVTAVCEGHEGPVNALHVSPNGRYVVSGSEDATLRFWDMASGQCVRVFEGHSGAVTSVALSQDGRYGLSGSEDSTLKLWDIDAGRCVRTLKGHSEGVCAVAFSRDERYFLSGAMDKTVRLWEVAGRRCICTFQKHTETVTSVALSLDGQWALSGSRDRTLKLWRLSPDTQFQLAPLALSRAHRTETVLFSEQAFKKALDDARRALAGGDDVAAARQVREARARPGFQRRAEALREWFRLYVHLPKVALNGAWEGASLHGHSGRVESVSLSGDGCVALTGGEDTTLRLWEVASGRCLRTFEGHRAAVNSACLSKDGRYALSASEDTTVKLWDVKSGNCLRTFQGHTGSVESVAFSSDAVYAVSAGWDLRFWHVPTGQCLRTLEGHTADVLTVVWSYDDRFILSGSSDESLKLWEVATGRCLCTLRGHSEPVRSVCLSADGRFAISGSGGLYAKPGVIKLWELSSTRCLYTLEGHADSVSSVCLSSDGRFALSGSKDGALKLWELTSGTCVWTFRGHTEGVQSVLLSRDGRYALSASRDGIVKVWILDWGLEEKPERDWDKGATPYLASFLLSHTPYARTLPEGRPSSHAELARALTRRGRPTWTEDDFDQLLYTLGCVGYGWLRPEGVRRSLERMAAKRRYFSLFSRGSGL